MKTTMSSTGAELMECLVSLNSKKRYSILCSNSARQHLCSNCENLLRQGDGIANYVTKNGHITYTCWHCSNVLYISGNFFDIHKHFRCAFSATIVTNPFQQKNNIHIGTFYCNRCKSEFENKQSLTDHYIDVHKPKPCLNVDLVDDNTSNISLIKGTTYNCQECSSTYRYESSLKQHVKSKHHYPCGICNCSATFHEKQARKKHWRTHSVSMDNLFCQFCGKSVKLLRSLVRHLEAHGDDIRILQGYKNNNQFLGTEDKIRVEETDETEDVNIFGESDVDNNMASDDDDDLVVIFVKSEEEDIDIFKNEKEEIDIFKSEKEDINIFKSAEEGITTFKTEESPCSFQTQYEMEEERVNGTNSSDSPANGEDVSAKQYTCFVCDSICPSADALTQHMDEHSLLKDYDEEYPITNTACADQYLNHDLIPSLG